MHSHKLRVHAYFFVGFSQCCIDNRFTFVNSSARKTYFTLMI